jgi:hypothetical protein
MSLSGFTPVKIYGETGIMTTGTGAAKSVFNNPSGTYNVVVSYIDEKDGQGTLELYAGGRQIADWKLTEDVACWRRKSIRNVKINKGDEIKIVAVMNVGETACIDYIEFIR